MKRKIVNGIQLFAAIAVYLSLKYNYVVYATGNRISVWDFCKKFSFSFYPSAIILLIIIVLDIASIAMKNDHKDHKIHSILAVILELLLNYHIIIGVATIHEDCKMNMPLFFTFEVFLFIVLVLGFVKRSKAICGDDRVVIVNESLNTSTNADELKKYKDLFDSGAITQEEFDAKKKELLGL